MTSAAAADVAATTAAAATAAAAAAAVCARITEGDTAICAFVPEPDRQRRLAAEAQAADRRWPAGSPRPALFGIPVGVKDIIRADGLKTAAGSALPPAALAGPEAVMVRRLRDAGALVAGKTVTAEFAITVPGPTRNPRQLDHTPGGSSSGSAAAVAAGLVPLALGTQTIASVIRPAAYCGVAGFRPTHGRIPADGIIAFAPSLDTPGCFAPDVTGLAAAAAVLCNDWRRADAVTTDQATGLATEHRGALPVLGIPVGGYLAQASTAALAAFRRQTAALAAAGFSVREIPALDDAAATGALVHVITRYEAAQVHAGWFGRYADRYQDGTAAVIRQGQLIERAEYDAGRDRQARFAAKLAELTRREGIDVWLTPAATGPAPAGLASTGSPVMSMPWSLAGLPALSLPAGLVGGLPVGLQCVAEAGCDEDLLRWAAALASALGEQRG